MRLAYCDRCGAAHGSLRGRVVEVSFDPMQRRVDLCGCCRSDFAVGLDVFLKTRGDLLPRLRARITALEIGRERRKRQISKLNATISELRRGRWA